MSYTEKPPLGVMPRWFHDRNRLFDLMHAVHRYSQVGKAVPEEWVVEAIELAQEMTAAPSLGGKRGEV